MLFFKSKEFATLCLTHALAAILLLWHQGFWVRFKFWDLVFGVLESRLCSTRERLRILAWLQVGGRRPVVLLAYPAERRQAPVILQVCTGSVKLHEVFRYPTLAAPQAVRLASKAP